MKIIYTYINTPLCKILLTAQGQSLTGIYLDGQKYMPAIDTSWEHQPDAQVFKTTEKQLLEYCSGTRTSFSIPYQFAAGTQFQQQVWSGIATIPFGKTVSYKELAERIGRPVNSVRAVGSATGKNPLTLLVPCHRVVGSNGSLTGFAAGLNCKKQLLDLEKNR